MIVYSTTERPGAAEYVRFLARSELGRMYPRQRFRARIARLLENADVVVTARDAGRLVGVCLGISDRAYLLFVTDIGVARGYERRGIGGGLRPRAERAVAGDDELCVVTWSNRAARPFYAACGLEPHDGLLGRDPSSWELFDVRELEPGESAEDAP